MARIDPSECSINQVAFLDMIAFSEIGSPLLAVSDDGYNVLEGATAAIPLLFDSYDTFPAVALTGAHTSSAAGRYQLLARYFAPYAKTCDLTDFSPVSQDKIALQQIKECRAIPLIEAGNIEQAIARCAHIWASLPGAGYGQHENKIGLLTKAYTDAGGVIS